MTPKVPKINKQGRDRLFDRGAHAVPWERSMGRQSDKHLTAHVSHLYLCYYYWSVSTRKHIKLNAKTHWLFGFKIIVS